jgi:hypothetical protein
MRRGSRLAFIGVAWCVAFLGCNSSDDCGQPDHVVFRCVAQPLDVPGCTFDGADASYPEGCEEVLPDCLSDYQEPTTCYCRKQSSADSTDASTFGFECPL